MGYQKGSLNVVKQDSMIYVEAQELKGFYMDVVDTGSNRSALVIFLRSLKRSDGSPLFSQASIAGVLGSENKQATESHEQKFIESGGDLGSMLKRKRKVDEEVVEAVKEQLKVDVFMSVESLCRLVNKRLGVTDLSESNIRAALDQIPGNYVRGLVLKQLERGEASYKEGALLEQVLEALSGSEGSVEVQEKLEKGGVLVVESAQEVEVRVSELGSVSDLLTPGQKVEDVSYWALLCVVMLALYGWGVPFSRLGRWLGVHKTTALRWVVGLSGELWPVVSGWIAQRVKPYGVYVDEKWLKIRKKWYYWFVGIDSETGLPLVDELLNRTTYANCSFVLLKLKRLYPGFKVLITDGLKGYGSAVLKWGGGVIHQTCLFHYQQGIGRWLRDHIEDKQLREILKPLMKEVFQTSCAQTVVRRLVRLYEISDLLGIKAWVEQTLEKLPRLLPTLQRQGIPNTSNAIERFFRAFNRFYKVRCGFHSKDSAKRQLVVFLVFYVFTQQECDGKAPLERTLPWIKHTPFYQIINNPLQVLMSLKLQYESVKSQEQQCMTELAA
jgi:transposase-like protein